MRYLKVVPFLILLVLLCGCESNPGKYPGPGRYTVELFGDWRFEIGRVGYDGVHYYCLYDRMEDHEGAVEGDITNYIEIEPCIYVIGTKGCGSTYEIGSLDTDTETEESKTRFIPIRETEKTYYTKVNYETGEIQQETELSAFSEEDISIFEELSESESAFKDK